MKRAAFQILQTKVNKPHLQSNLIARPDLFQLLQNSCEKRLVLVTAPAGFGKSTLVRAWLEQQSCPYTWLSLDQADNDPSRFFSYFFAALSQLLPDCQSASRKNYSFADSPHLEDVLGSLIHPLEELPGRAVFIIDDYHLIQNQAVHDILLFILKNLTLLNGKDGTAYRGILPVLISRADPPFSLSKWRLQGELTEIRMNDLRISDADARSFLSMVTGTSISPELARGIVAQTEGWIAGLQMAAISFNEQHLQNLDTFIAGFNGGNHLVADYLLNEVMALLPRQQQQFLIETSILERLSGPVCNAMLSATDSQQQLEMLEKSNLFIIPLDDQRGWYRYHHLLSNYLRKRREQLPSDEFFDLHIRAAEWFEANQFLDEAIQHYLSAGCVDEAVSIIIRNSSSILNQGRILYLGELISYIPREAFDRFPWLCIYHGWKDAILETGEDSFWTEKAELLISIESAAGKINASEKDEMLGNIAAIKVQTASRRGDVSTTFELVPVALELLPPTATNVRGLVIHAMGKCQYLSGDLIEAKNTFLKASDELIPGGNISGSFDAIWLAGEIALIHGRLNEAEAIFSSQTISSDLSDRPTCLPFLSYSGLGKVQYEWNQIDKALENLQTGYASSKRYSNSSLINAGAALADIRLKMREWNKAEAVLLEMKTPPGKVLIHPDTQSNWFACWIRLYTHTNRLRQAERIITERNLPDILSTPVYQEPEALAVLEYLLACQKYEEILQICPAWVDRLLAQGRNHRAIQALLIQTAACEASGSRDAAIHSLTRALSAGRLEGYLRSYIDAGEPIFNLLLELTQNPTGYPNTSFDSDYVNDIIRASMNSGISTVDQSRQVRERKTRPDTGLTALDIHLTPPEVSILRLLVAGCDNFEIASNLKVSINTVKTHIIHIFRKLGVHNRVQAANRAKMLKLI